MLVGAPDGVEVGTAVGGCVGVPVGWPVGVLVGALHCSTVLLSKLRRLLTVPSVIQQDKKHVRPLLPFVYTFVVALEARPHRSIMPVRLF